MRTVKQIPSPPRRSCPRLLSLAALALLLAPGCAARNVFGREVRVEAHPFEHDGHALEYWAGHAQPEAPGLPVVVFLEGDGSQCQAYSEGRWARFLIRSTGHAVLVRPRTWVNTVCDTEAFERADFLHRVSELRALLQVLARSHPGQRLYLVGHSAGAHLALLAAESEPGLISGLVNVSGSLWPLSDLLPEIARERLRRGERTQAQHLEAKASLDALVERVRAHPASDERMWGRTLRFWNQMFFSDVRQRWLSTPLPVLVLHGTEDLESVPFSAVVKGRAETEAAARRNFTFRFFEGRGHDLLGEETWREIDAWIAEQERRRSP